MKLFSYFINDVSTAPPPTAPDDCVTKACKESQTDQRDHNHFSPPPLSASWMSALEELCFLYGLRQSPPPPTPSCLEPPACPVCCAPLPHSRALFPLDLPSITPLIQGNASSSLLQPLPAWAAGSGEWLGACRGTFGNWTIPSFLAGSRERWVGVLRRSPPTPSVSPQEPGYQSRDL